MKKQEIRHDPVRENIIKGVDYLKENKRKALNVLLFVILIVAGFGYYTRTGNIRDMNANDMAGRAQNSYIDGQTEIALNQFQNVLNDYPDSPAAVQSLVYLLNDAYSQNDMDKATSLLDELSAKIKDRVISSAFYKLRGDIALDDDSPAEALAFYKKAESNSSDTGVDNKYKLSQASALIAKGDLKVAKRIIDNVLDNGNPTYSDKTIAEELQGFVNYKLGI